MGATAKADFELQEKVIFDLQSAIQNMNKEYNNVQHSMQILKAGLGKDIGSIHEEFTIIKNLLSDLKAVIVNNDQDVKDVSNDIEQVKVSYKKEKEQNELAHAQLEHRLQV